MKPTFTTELLWYFYMDLIVTGLRSEGHLISSAEIGLKMFSLNIAGS